VKELFSEVRIPLAKFKKSGREENLHSGDARFIFHPTKGIGFRVLTLGKDNKLTKSVVYRETLSNSLLNLLGKLKTDIDRKEQEGKMRERELLNKAGDALRELLKKSVKK